MRRPLSTHAKTAAACAVFAALLILLVRRTLGVLNVPDEPLVPGAWGLQDFRDAVYYPTRALLDGVNPYDSLLYMSRYPVGQHFPPYSPLLLIVHLPLMWLTASVAQWVYFAFLIGLYVAIAVVTLRFSGRSASLFAVTVVAALILASRPGYMNLTIGQLGAQLTLGALVSLQFAHSRPRIAGLGLLLLSLKVTWFVPMIVLFWLMGHRRCVLYGVLFTFVFTLGPLLYIVTLSGGVQEFVSSLTQNAAIVRQHADPTINFTRLDLIGVVVRLFVNDLPVWSELLLTFGVLGVTAMCLGVHGRNSGWVDYYKANTDSNTSNTAALGNEPVGAFSIPGAVIILALLLCTYRQPYEGIVLIIPIGVAIRVLWQRHGRTSFGRWDAARWAAMLMLLTSTALALNYVSSHGVFDALATQWNVPMATAEATWPVTLLKSINGLLTTSAWLTSLVLALGFKWSHAHELEPS